MKTFVSLLAGLLLAPAALSAAEFEGKVTFKMSSGRDKAQDIRYAIKNGRFRIELPGQSGMGGMIVDPVKRESIVLMDQQKMYMVMAMPDVPPAEKAGKGDGATLEKTGQTEKILGYTAEEYISKSADATTELWLAEGLGTFVGFSNSNPMGGGRRGGSAPAAQAWERALAGKEMFPLRVVSRDHANKETFKLEATSIDKTGLPDAMFAPPADYQKFDMGNMMKGMMPGKK